MDEKWYYGQGNTKMGPLTRSQMDSEIRKGNADERTMVWHTGMRDWQPAAKVRELQPVIEATRAAQGQVGGGQLAGGLSDGGRSDGHRSAGAGKQIFRQHRDHHNRPAPSAEYGQHQPYVALGRPQQITVGTDRTPAPWRRFFARWLDVMLETWGGMALVACLGLAFSFDFSGPAQLIAIEILTIAISVVVIDAAMLSSFGTTPGKWMMGVHVRNFDGSMLTFRQAVARNVGVVVIGYGLFVLFFITWLVSFQRLIQRGKTTWDEMGDYVVTTSPFDWSRLMTGGFCAILMMIFFVWVRSLAGF